jgi:hypothetical protein
MGRSEALAGTAGTTYGTSRRSAAVFATGIAEGTQIAAAAGWRRIEDLRPGDRVLTVDAGLLRLRGIQRQVPVLQASELPESARPLALPPRALGNREPTILLPDQAVMIESEAAEAIYGDPMALLPARALIGLRGIAPALSAAPTVSFQLLFDAPQLVYANVGAMFLCPAAAQDASAAPGLRHHPLTLPAAQHLFAAMIAGEAGGASAPIPARRPLTRQAARARAFAP